jgi:thiol-disulfide isomerase/thioredoxin
MSKRYVFPVLFAFVLSLTLSCSKASEEPKRVNTSIAPIFAVEDVDGNKVDLGAYRGKVVILDFFATWCEPCRLLAPELQTVYERYKDRGVAVIALSADEGPDAAASVRAFIKELRVSYTVAVAGDGVMKQYGAYSLPTTVIIDREGKIRSKHLGITADYAKRIASEIELLLK